MKIMKNKLKLLLCMTLISSIELFSIQLIKSASNTNYIAKSISDILINEEIELKSEEIRNLIEKNSLELKKYKLRVEQNKNLLQSSIALWYPSLNLNSTGLPKYLDGSNINDSSVDTLSQQINASLSAEIKWDLINPSRKAQISIAKANLEKAQYAYLIKLRDLEMQAMKEFYKLQNSYANVKVAEKSIEYSKINLKEAKIKLDSGIGTRLEVLEAKTQLSQDTYLFNSKLGEQRINQRQLAEILNLPSNSTPIIKTLPKINGIWNTSIEESIINAFSYRKELDEILIQKSINNNNAESALAETKPKVSIFNSMTQSFSKGETFVASPDMRNSASSFNNTLGIKATWKIIDGGKAKYLYKYNLNKAKEEQNNYTLKLGKIRNEVEKSYYKLETAKKNIIATSEAKKSAQESLRLAKLRFKSGINTQREVVNQQRDLTQAEVNHIESISNYNIYLSELKRQTGIKRVNHCPNEKSNLRDMRKEGANVSNNQSNIFLICN